ncbi:MULTISPECIES: ThuA domain-containing protein [Chitinophagaceae]
MKKANYTLFLGCFVLLAFCSFKKKTKVKVLVFSKTAGFHHASIPTAIAAIQHLGKENGFDIDTTTNASLFNKKNLKQYKAVIFASTTGTVLDSNQKDAFRQYIEHGGGYVGIHAATDTEYDWPWYNKLVGAYFSTHPHQQEAKLIVVDKNNPATKHLPSEWTRKDEWYNFKNIQTDLHVLITIDEKSYSGGTNGDFHPMAWYHDYDGGRAFYTALGHTDESYSDPLFLQHLLGGIQYAMGR